MHRFANDVGVLAPNVLLPKAGSDFSKWAVVACDQYTSQPEYWENAERIAGDAPTALHLILPEAYLGKPGEAERIEAIKACMQKYLERGALAEAGEGFVLVERTVEGNTRRGLVLALDLERYDYHRGAKTLIRATEGTIEERIQRILDEKRELFDTIFSDAQSRRQGLTQEEIFGLFDLSSAGSLAKAA